MEIYIFKGKFGYIIFFPCRYYSIACIRLVLHSTMKQSNYAATMQMCLIVSIQDEMFSLPCRCVMIEIYVAVKCVLFCDTFFVRGEIPLS